MFQQSGQDKSFCRVKRRVLLLLLMTMAQAFLYVVWSFIFDMYMEKENAD